MVLPDNLNSCAAATAARLTVTCRSSRGVIGQKLLDIPGDSYHSSQPLYSPIIHGAGSDTILTPNNNSHTEQLAQMVDQQRKDLTAHRPAATRSAAYHFVQLS